jgi:hypothetical protein
MSADNPREMANYQNDHDLLVELRTEMRGVREDIKGLSEGTSEKISDHETRLRALEKDGNRWFGKQSIIGALAAGAISIVVTYFASGGKV